MALDPAIVVAGIAAVPAVIGGTLGAYAGLKQRGNENLHLVITAMQQHMTTLASENTDMRARVTTAETKTAEVMEKLAKCDMERVELIEKVDNLGRRLDAAESRDGK